MTTANNRSTTVSVLLGNGDGTFMPAATYPVGSAPFGITAADFNCDGTIDLAVTNSGPGNVSILLGNGDGTFKEPAPVFPVGSNPNLLAAADFNGEGKVDLAVVNNRSNTVSILLNNTICETICIEVPRVLDFCFQTETTDICLPVAAFSVTSAGAVCACATGTTVACSVFAVTCTEIVPATGRVASSTPGFFNVTFAISFSLAISLVNAAGITTCATFVSSSTFTKTVVLCAPDGATAICEVTPACGLGICIDDAVCVSVNLCLVFKSVFPVVLAVTGTVLTPTLCVSPSPFPPVCPPTVPTLCNNCPSV